MEMQWVPAGKFRMGSDRHYPEEAPSHEAYVEGFWMDRYPVTNAEFARFVEQTGHVTFAEIPPKASDYPGALPELLKAGSLVFFQPGGPVDLRNIANWWTYQMGASWKHPLGPDSSIDSLLEHPVVHISYSDAEAYARWAGKQLPSESEWEYAARGGLENAEYAWGDEFTPGGRHMANTWQGEFPWQNLAADGHVRTSPVGSYPPNGYGLYDLIGNVWEWTTDWYRADHSAARSGCCGTEAQDSCDPRMPQIKIPRKVLKGGSHLCAPNYCRRYRPAARYPEPIDTSTSHVGFRCIKRRGPTPLLE